MLEKEEEKLPFPPLPAPAKIFFVFLFVFILFYFIWTAELAKQTTVIAKAPKLKFDPSLFMLSNQNKPCHRIGANALQCCDK